MKGKFIVFEGLDFTGKSTQAQNLFNYLQSIGKDCILTREPGGTELGETIRTLIMDCKELCKESEILLFMTSRAQNVYSTIIPALNAGKHVICDRFLSSTIAYQGALHNFKEEDIIFCHEKFNFGLYPDITFLLDADIKVIKNRRNLKIKAGFKGNKFDVLKDSDFKKIQECFLLSSNIKKLNTYILNAEREEGKILEDIKHEVLKII